MGSIVADSPETKDAHSLPQDYFTMQVAHVGPCSSVLPEERAEGPAACRGLPQVITVQAASLSSFRLYSCVTPGA